MRYFEMHIKRYSDASSLIIALLLLFPSVACSQDSHYWTNQYGTMANLLGGAVVGSVRDPSSVYYNPGALSLSGDTTLIISANVYQFREYRYKGWGVEDEDLVSRGGGSAPSMFAVRVPFKMAERHQLAISHLKRNDFDVELHGIVVDRFEAVSPDVGESFSAQGLIRQTMGEDWYGLTWSYGINERAAIGATWNVSVHSQRDRIEAIAKVLADDGAHGLLNIITDYNFYNVRMLWKVGVALDREPWAFGLTLTTPGLELFGSGSANYDIGLFDSEFPGLSVLDAGSMKDLDAHYRSPFSVAAGVSYSFGSTGLHLTAEWFDRVEEFEVMDLDGFVTDVGDPTIYPSIVHGLKEVLNFGIGANHEFRNGFAMYGGFTTDFSAYRSAEESMLSITTWDIYHATLGGSFSFYHIGFTAGLAYSFGEGTFDRIVDFSGLSESGELIAPTEENPITYRQLKFIVGLDY